MKAVILAGGEGTRLYPLTYTRPKSLIPIANRPMIDYVLDYFEGVVNEVVFAAGHMVDELQGYLDSSARNMEIRIEKEDTPLGTGGAVKNLESVLDEPFIVMNADIISSIQMADFISFSRMKGGMGSIVFFPSDHPEDYGVATLDDEYKITRFVEKPSPDEVFSNLVNAGAYFLDPEILKLIETNRMVSMEREIFPQVLDDGLYGYTFEGYWTDAGKISTLLEANELVLRNHGGRIDTGFDIGADVEVADPICVGAGSAMKAGKLGPDVSLGSDCEISSCEIEYSILFNSVLVGENVQIRNSILGEGVMVEDGSTLLDCVVADGERIVSGSNIVKQKVGMR